MLTELITMIMIAEFLGISIFTWFLIKKNLVHLFCFLVYLIKIQLFNINLVHLFYFLVYLIKIQLFNINLVFQVSC